MKILPQSTITLYSGVDIGTEQQLAFSSKAKQTAYFASKVKKSYVNCTVVKDKVGVLKVAIKPVGQAGTGEITGADLATCNYMSFVNPSFDNKTIYCYIVDYEYVNNETAYIRYTIDYWQTWCFDCTYHDMYIDREHLSQDSWSKVESNPYRDDIPEMVTEEPLPTPMGYEKPFYQIDWWNASGDHADGIAVMTREDADNAAYTIVSMLNGSWSFWSVMLIQAPTDWESFGEEDKSDDASTKWKILDVVTYNNNFYMCIADAGTNTFDPADTSTWSLITSAVDNFDGNTSPPVTSDDTPTIASMHYVLRLDGTLWRNYSASSQTFDITKMNAQQYFEQIPLYTDAVNKVKGELLNILGFYNTDILDECSDVAHNNTTYTGFTWSVKPRGADIYFIKSPYEFQRLCNFYSKYNAVSQIVALYGIPKWYLGRGLLDKTAMLPTIFGRLGGSDVVATNVSSARTSAAPGYSGAAGEQYAARNKKLFTSPFSYLRVVAPDGSIKEFNYEQFANVANGETSIRFKIIADLSGDEPKMYLIPKKYKTKVDIPSLVEGNIDTTTGVTGAGADFEDAMQFNCDEAICISGFPQIAFNTDGYLTFLGNQYAEYSAMRTSENVNKLAAEKWNMNSSRRAAEFGIGASSNVLSNTLGGVQAGAKAGGGSGALIGGIAGGVASIGQEGFRMFDSAITYNKNKAILDDEIAKYTKEASGWMNGDLLSTDDPNVNRFKNCKAAYANSVYMGGTGGVIRYLRGLGLFDFVFIHVQLRKEILEYYDYWFDLYGYSSGRCGIPHVIDFVKGETGATKVPHWVSLNSKNTTYVKTYDAKVEHAMLPVAQNIANMFNRGIRFIKGDLS